MKKLYKANKGGSVAVTVSKTMKAAGYLPGVPVEWEAQTGGFLLRLKPSIPVIYTKPETVLETL